MIFKIRLMCFPHYTPPPDSVHSSPENKWVVIVDRASLLLIHALSGIYKVQEQSWRLLELHSLKIVSTGIIWVSLQEVGLSWTRFNLCVFSFNSLVFSGEGMKVFLLSSQAFNSTFFPLRAPPLV